MSGDAAGFRIVGARTIANSGFLRLDRLHVAAPDGTAVRREVVRHPGAVAVVPVVGEDVVLIRQYRAAVDALVLELPAGKLDVPGEPPETTARRELEEEIGYRPGKLEHLGSFYTGPGFTDEHMTLYLASGCTPVAMTPVGIEEQYAEVVRVPTAAVADLVASGEIRDAKTLVGLYAFLLRA